MTNAELGEMIAQLARNVEASFGLVGRRLEQVEKKLEELAAGREGKR